MPVTMGVTLAGEVAKYKAEIWNSTLTEKLSDFPLGVQTNITTDGVSNDWQARCLVVTPLEGIVYDRYTDNIDLDMPWISGPTFGPIYVAGDPVMPGSVGMRLYDTPFNNVSNPPITFEFFLIGEVNTATPFNRLHLMDKKALEDFSKVRLIETDTDGNEIRNYSSYIVNMLQLGFKLPDEYIAGESNIKLDSLNTGILTPIYNDDDIVIDLGSITIPPSNSSLDYFNNKFELFLPFIESPIDMLADLVIGKTLKVEYVIDLYSGDLTVNIFNGEETPFHSSTSTIGRNVPVKISTDTTYSMTGTSGVLNDVMRAYVRHSKPELVEGQFYNLVSKEGAIGAYKGYLEVDNIELTGKALSDEKQQILAVLRNGVIIK